MFLFATVALPQVGAFEGDSRVWLGLIGVVLLILFFGISFLVKQYKRCPSNRILVIYGRVAGAQAAQCLHGGGKFIIPLLQDYAFLPLEPLVIDIPLEGALSLNNIRVNVPSTFTVGISTNPVLMNSAAERLLHLDENQIREQAQDIILGQLRLVIATLSIEEINKDREKFMNLINTNVAEEINKVGLALINVNVRDITDESRYIEAIGKRAAAEAINRAKVEVAQQDRDGATGQKDAQRDQRVRVAALEATAIEGEVKSKRDYEIATAEREAETIAAKKNAEQEQRVQVAAAESTAVQGENSSQGEIANSNAQLAEVRAEAKRRAEIAAAQADEAIFEAQREQEIARLGKDELAPQEIEKERVEIKAEATAEQLRREARGEADAMLAKFVAEAEGTQKVLEAKAAGYQRLVEACAGNPQIAPTLLMIEQLPTLVAEQVKAIQNLKIDKITVWDSGNGGRGSKHGGGTADFLSSLIGSLPAIHELAEQAGIELPAVLGKVIRNSARSEPTETKVVEVEELVKADEP